MAHIMRDYWQTLAQLPSHLTTTRQQTYAAIATTVFLGGALATWRRSREPRKLTATHDPNSPCKLILDDSRSDVLQLPNGRKIGYAQYGSSDGIPIVVLHGTPSSRLEAAHLDQPAKDLGVRIIALDRPGMGWSSPQPGRTLLDHADDVEEVTTHLGLSEYSVFGVSGGGPYALACAYALPAEKLKRVAVAAGMGMPDMSKRGMRWWNWLGFGLGFRYGLTGLKLATIKWVISADPATQVDLPEETRFPLIKEAMRKDFTHPKDVALTQDADFDDFIRLASRSLRQAFAQGLDWWNLDAQLMANDWGFRLEDIRPDLEIQLWYGKFDVHCPPVYGEETAARLRGSNVRLKIEDETHLSLFVNWKEEFLRELIEVR